MQVTDEMVLAARQAVMQVAAAGNLDRMLRAALTAALDVAPKATGGYVPGPAVTEEGFEGPGVRDAAGQTPIEVREPRPLATINQLRYHLGKSLDFVLGATLRSSGYDPPFPEPVRQGKNGEPLYDPEEVKTWYDALPQEGPSLTMDPNDAGR